MDESPAAGPPAPGTRIPACRTCGLPLTPHEKFCGNCGTRAGDAPAASAPATVPAPPSSTPPTPGVVFVAGVLVCRACGNPIKPGDRFCARCLGNVPEDLTAVPAASRILPPPAYQTPTDPVPSDTGAPSGHACASCGSSLSGPEKFCGICGTPVARSIRAASVHAPAPSPAAPRPGKFCGNCGRAVPGTARFCGGCGAALYEVLPRLS